MASSSSMTRMCADGAASVSAGRGGALSVVATADPADGGGEVRFDLVARLDGAVEVDYWRQGGILQAVLRRLARESAAV